MVIVAVTVELPRLTAKNAGMLPVPLAASPIEEVLFVHKKDVPATAPVKIIVETLILSHTSISAGLFTVGLGFTVII